MSLMQILMKNFSFRIRLKSPKHCCFIRVFYWLFDDWLKKYCWNRENFDANINSHNFFVLVSKTLIFLCCFSEDSLITHWSLIDGSVKVSIESKLILLFFCANLWNIDVLLLLNWWFVAGTLVNYWRHGLEFIWYLMFCFECANMRNIDIPLVLQWCLVDASLRENWWNGDDMDANNNDHLCFFCANFSIFNVSLLPPWNFVEESLKNILWDIDVFDPNSDDKKSF